MFSLLTIYLIRETDDGVFGSKFVTVCVTGNKDKEIHMEGYQVYFFTGILYTVYDIYIKISNICLFVSPIITQEPYN